jgi:hypothetical protein
MSGRMGFIILMMLAVFVEVGAYERSEIMCTNDGKTAAVRLTKVPKKGGYVPVFDPSGSVTDTLPLYFNHGHNYLLTLDGGKKFYIAQAYGWESDSAWYILSKKSHSCSLNFLGELSDFWGFECFYVSSLDYIIFYKPGGDWNKCIGCQAYWSKKEISCVLRRAPNHDDKGDGEYT